MPKSTNLVGTEQITISVTPHVVEALKELVMSGFYGKNVADAAERLLSRILEERRGNQSLAPMAEKQYTRPPTQN